MDEGFPLECGAVKLDRWRREDAERLALIGDSRAISDNMTDGFPSPYTLEKAAAFIEKALAADRSLSLSIWSGGELVGSIGAVFYEDIYRFNASIGYFVGVGYWGQGIATAAIRALSRELFERHPIRRIFAEPFARNLGSRRALEKSGFSLEGLLREGVVKGEEVLDSCVYACLRRDYEATAPCLPPGRPTSFEALPRPLPCP